MIAKSVRGNDAYGLAEYLHGAGHSEEHHWVNSRGERVSGGVVLAGDFVHAGETDGRKWARGFARLAKRKAKDRPIKNAVYHVSLSTAPGDRQLSNAEWVEAAHIWLREHDAENQPFVLVRHDERHVHMAVSRIGFDLSVHRFPHDYTRNELACREIEKRFGLEQLPTREQRRGTRRNSLDRVTRAEKEMRARGVKPRKDIMREQLAASVAGNSLATPARIPATLAPGVVAVARAHLDEWLKPFKQDLANANARYGEALAKFSALEAKAQAFEQYRGDYEALTEAIRAQEWKADQYPVGRRRARGFDKACKMREQLAAYPQPVNPGDRERATLEVKQADQAVKRARATLEQAQTQAREAQPPTPTNHGTQQHQDAALAKAKDEFFAELKAQYDKPAEQATVQNVLKAVQSPPQTQNELTKTLKDRADRLKNERAQTQRQQNHRRGHGR